MRQNISNAPTINEKKAKSCENTSYALKYAALGIKEIPGFSKMSHCAKLLATATSGFSNYYKGERADVAATMAIIDLGLTTVFVPYRLARLTAPLLKAAGADKAAHFFKSTLDEFNKIVAITLLNPDNVALCDFMDHKVDGLANRSQMTLIENEFANIVHSLAQKYEWSSPVEECFSVLFSFRVAQHLAYDETSGFNIIPPQIKNPRHEMPGISDGKENGYFLKGSLDPALKRGDCASPPVRSAEFNENTIKDVVTRVYDTAMHAFESKLPELYAEHFTSSMMKNNVESSMTIREEQLTQLMEATTGKIRETVEQQSTATQVISIQCDHWQIGLRDISSMMQDGALLAAILQKPAITHNLSSAGAGIERAVTGIDKVNKATSFLSKLSGIVSLATGIAGIFSAIVGFFSNANQEDRLSELGRQIEHLGKQLDCVLKNQIIMVDMLAVTQRRMMEMNQRLIHFAKTTKLNFEFLKTKELVEAYTSIDRHLKKTSAIQLTENELRQKLIILETWLRDHLSSPIMNGAMYADASPAEAIEILSVTANDAASMNMVGFVLARLQRLNIVIPPEFSQLPPLDLYAEIAGIFTLGMEALKPVSSDGCHAFANELQEKFKLFSGLLDFLEKNEKMWRELQQHYVTHKTNAQHALASCFWELNENNIDPNQSLQVSLAKLTNSSSKKIDLFDKLDAMEEVRLLHLILSKWTHRFIDLVSQAFTSKERFLTAHAKISSDLHFYGSSLSTFWSRDDSANWVVESVKYEDHDRKSAPCYNVIIQMGSLAKSFQNPFRNPCGELMKKMFSYPNLDSYNIILYLAADSESDYFRTGSTRWDLGDTPRGVVYEYRKKDDFCCTDFMVLITLFAVDKLLALRNAYQYYIACYNGDSAEAEKRRATIDPFVLLWLTAILGRYDIFLSVKKPQSFNFSAALGSKPIVSSNYGNKNCFGIDISRCYTPEMIRKYGGSPYKTMHHYTSPTIPLMVAVKCNRIDVVKGLLKEHLEHGKDIGLLKKDFNGQTSAEIAFKQGHYALSKLLDEHSHTLSQSEREIAEREVVKNTTLAGTTNSAIANTLSLGSLFARRLEENYRHNELENDSFSVRSVVE